MTWATVLTALTAIFKFLNIVLSKQREVDVKQEEDKDALKEEMHKALLSGDNSAIVRCLNEYGKLRQNKTIDP